jgi:transcriptional regulator with XRE-family HTH domain
VAAAVARNLRRLRQHRGWSLEVLATRSGVSRGMLIQVEQQRTNPSLQTLVRLCEALDVSVARLVELDEVPSVRVVPSERAAVLWTGPAGGSATLLVGSDRSEHLELWSWRLLPGEAHASEAHAPGTQELLHVTDGELVLDVAGAVCPVPCGAGVLLQADRPHTYRNDSAGPVAFTMTVAQPVSDFDPTALEAGDHRGAP